MGFTFHHLDIGFQQRLGISVTVIVWHGAEPSGRLRVSYGSGKVVPWFGTQRPYKPPEGSGARRMSSILRPSDPLDLAA